MHKIILIFALVAAFLISFIIFRIINEKKIEDEDILKSRKILQSKEQEEKEEKYKKLFFRSNTSYERTLLYLSKNGVDFHMGRNVTPSEFIMIKTGVATLFAIFGVMCLGPLGILAGIAGYVMVPTFFCYLNKQDNEKMLTDIKNVYDTLVINMEAGAFITAGFMDVYRNISNARLKKAILELNSEIVATNDAEEAIDKFENKFNNLYINNLCVILRQSLQTGMSVTMLTDMSKQMADVTTALNQKRKRKLDNKIFKIEVMLLIGIVAVCMYIAFGMYASTMAQF
jgi:Flp pilus assembly protein TadB